MALWMWVVVGVVGAAILTIVIAAVASHKFNRSVCTGFSPRSELECFLRETPAHGRVPGAGKTPKEK